MNMLGNLGVLLIGIGVCFLLVTASIFGIIDDCRKLKDTIKEYKELKQEIPKGDPPGSYEDDTEWKFKDEEEL